MQGTMTSCNGNRAWAQSLSIGLLMCLSFLCNDLAYAESPSLDVNNARIRLLPGDLPLAGYFTLTNTGKASITLTSAASPAFKGIMLHRSMESGGQSQMKPVVSLEIKPGQSIQFKPGGYHLMLMHRNHELEVGQTVPITLNFANGDVLQTLFSINAADTE